MPVLFLAQAAQAKIAHCVINNGYKIRNGGLGNVNPIHTAQTILMNQAVISMANRNGHFSKSSLAQLYIPTTVLLI
jgi:hypothetical protein